MAHFTSQTAPHNVSHLLYFREFLFTTGCRQLRCTPANFPPTAVAFPSTTINRCGL